MRRARARLGLRDRAAGDFREAIRLAPDSLPGYLSLGGVCLGSLRNRGRESLVRVGVVIVCKVVDELLDRASDLRQPGLVKKASVRIDLRQPQSLQGDLIIVR